MELQIESESFDPDGHFLFWKPGSPPIVEPPGLALRLDPGNDLVLNTHLQPSGKPEQVQPTIGIYFTNEPARRFPVLLQLENDRALDLRPDGVGIDDGAAVDRADNAPDADVAVFRHLDHRIQIAIHGFAWAGAGQTIQTGSKNHIVGQLSGAAPGVHARLSTLL